MTQNLKNKPNSSLLKETRLNKGLTLEIVHESTKIPMDALRAIEDGYSTRILTPFYYRGFIKIYAEFLELNVNDVLKEYNVQASFAKTVVKKPVASKAAPAKTFESKGPDVAQQFSEFWRNFWTAKTQRNALRLLAAVVAIFIVVKFVGCVANFIKFQPKNPKTAVVNKPVNKKSSKKEKAQSQDQAEVKETAKSAGEGSYPSSNNKVTLAVHASKDTWIQVKTDGKVAFQMTMKKGTMENWEASDDIELSGKNLSNLELEVNGKDVSPIASFSRNAKKVVITKDGLSVKK